MIYLAVGFLSAATVPLLLVDDSFASACLFPRARYAPNELLRAPLRRRTMPFSDPPRRNYSSFVRSLTFARSLAKEILQSPQFERLHRRRPLTSSRMFSAVGTLCLTFLYLAEKVRTMSREREKKELRASFSKRFRKI